MKKLKVFVVALALLNSSTAFAQFSKPSNLSSASSDKYTRLYASYSLGVASSDKPIEDLEGESIPDIKGATVGFAIGKSLSADMPLFFEYGAELGFGKASYEKSDYNYNYYDNYDEEWEITSSLTMMNIAIPLNFVYELPISDDLRIAPFAGLNMKCHLMGKAKIKEEVDYLGIKEKEELEVNIFDEDDMGDNKAKRFQIGANLGAHLYFKDFVLSYRFQPDFNPIIEADGTKGKIKTQMFSVGIRF